MRKTRRYTVKKAANIYKNRQNAVKEWVENVQTVVEAVMSLGVWGAKAPVAH